MHYEFIGVIDHILEYFITHILKHIVELNFIRIDINRNVNHKQMQLGSEWEYIKMIFFIFFVPYDLLLRFMYHITFYNVPFITCIL